MLESIDSRKIVAFDAFGDFPTDKITNKEDVEFIQKFESTGGGGLGKMKLVPCFSIKGC